MNLLPMIAVITAIYQHACTLDPEALEQSRYSIKQRMTSENKILLSVINVWIQTDMSILSYCIFTYPATISGFKLLYSTRNKSYTFSKFSNLLLKLQAFFTSIDSVMTLGLEKCCFYDQNDEKFRKEIQRIYYFFPLLCKKRKLQWSRVV